MLTTNKSLSVLHLSHCGITDAIMKYIGTGLTKNKSLKVLSINSEHLTNEGLKCLYQSLKQNETITIIRQFGINLKVLHNPFGLVVSTDCDTHAVLKIFKSLEQETTVDKLVISTSVIIRHYERFSKQNMDDETLGCAMEKMLVVSQTLRILDLQNCPCSDVLINHIATALARNCSVKQLVLKVTGIGAARIFKSLKCNTNLNELDLCYSYRSARDGRDDGEALGLAVEEMLTVNQTLKSLNLQNYSLNNMIIDHMSAALAKNSSINRLVLKVTYIGAVHIFKSLEHNTNLKELVILKDTSWYLSAKDL